MAESTVQGQKNIRQAQRNEAKKAEQTDKLTAVTAHRDELVTENEALKRAGKKNDRAAEKLEQIEEILKS